jgi:hypothetical protein
LKRGAVRTPPLDIPENLPNYIDYKAIACDIGYNSEIVEIEREVTINNANIF